MALFRLVLLSVPCKILPLRILKDLNQTPIALESEMSMQTSSTEQFEAVVQLPVSLVAELQDSLLVVVHDLSRLDGLLSHAMENLMERFTRVSSELAGSARIEATALDSARNVIGAAVMELQFHDMATQLITHTSKILQGCAYRLAAESMGAEEGEAMSFVEAVPDRPYPVTQDEMDAGSIELF